MRPSGPRTTVSMTVASVHTGIFVGFFLRKINQCSPFCFVEISGDFCTRKMTVPSVRSQWRIQDFPGGMGTPTPKLGLFCKFFAKSCMKMKEFGPTGGGGAPLRPANVPVAMPL